MVYDSHANGASSAALFEAISSRMPLLLADPLVKQQSYSLLTSCATELALSAPRDLHTEYKVRP